MSVEGGVGEKSSVDSSDVGTTQPTGQPEGSLRKKILRGGAFLAIRQAIGVVLSIAGVLLVTRVIGPQQYGIYATAMSIVVFLSTVGTWGVDIYLLRKTEMPLQEEFDQGFTLLLCISLLFCGGIVILSPLIAAFVKMAGVSKLLMFVALAIPLNLLALPAVVRLDRDLNFKQVGINELLGQGSMYALSIPWAFAGGGAWAPATGFVLQQLVILIFSYRSARYIPALRWNHALIARMLKYGLSYSSSNWVWQLRGLVNPLVVGRFAGAEAVGYIAVSIRFVEVLTFAKQVTWRIAMAALAKMSNDRVRLRNSVTEGMKLQAIAVGLPLAPFALVGPILIPLGLGHKWAPALVVFPFIAVSYLTNAMFNLHSSVLYLREENLQVTIFHTVHIVLFGGSAAVLVPRLGFVGYGWAELVALLSYPVLHSYFTRQVDSPSYKVAGIWFVTTSCVLAVSCMKPPYLYLGFAILLLPLIFPRERASMIGYARILFPWMAA